METLCELTLDEYDRLIAEGVFADRKRLELVAGKLVPMLPIGPLHETAVDLLNAWSIQRIGTRAIRVRVQNSIGLTGLDSAPQPDLAWVRRRDFRRRRPQSRDVLLVIEVADSSLAYDRDVKGPLYAEAGLPEYWLVDLEHSTIEVHRRPVKGAYQEVREATLGECISPLALKSATLRVGWLFGAEQDDG